jgi:hypothetical protein
MSRERPANGWDAFWFDPRPTSALALFRIVYGLVVFLWALAYLGDARSLLGSNGILPEHPEGRLLRSGLLHLFTSDLAAMAAVAGLALVGLLLAAGIKTRLVSIVNFALLLSITRRSPDVINSGDSLLRHFGFFLMFAPAGASLSWDRWRKHRETFWEVPWRAPWAHRLIQIQVSFVYLFSAYAKAQGPDWVGGTALAEVWRAGDLVRFDVPLPIYDSLLMSNLASYATMLAELALAVLIWNRRARPYVIAAGLILHLGIEITLAVGFFSTVVCTGYLAFVPEERASEAIGWLRERLVRSGRPRLRAFAAAAGEPPIRPVTAEDPR